MRNKHLDAHVHVAQVDALARGERTRRSRHFILQELAASFSFFRLAALYGLCHYPSLRRWTTARNSFGPRGDLPCKILADRAADSRDGTYNAVGLGFVGLVTYYFACDYPGASTWLYHLSFTNRTFKYFLNKMPLFAK